ncbi:radical SAM protein [Pseudodesulfovibrio sp.]|nr:radical SAM protein [Pseudodesulfovibrio sp.]
MPNQITFTHPEPSPLPTRVWPVFLPFAGCPYRCVFCAQDKQTGQDETELETILHTLEHDLNDALAAGRDPFELAFYGGTFTALPTPWPEMFLGLAMRFRERGLITHVRCSTRPDCVDDLSLSMLRAQGLDMVELGIQSFDDGALKASGRGYDGDTAKNACQLVKSNDLGLGIQLLPGLPGDRPGVFQEDVRTTAELEPETARLYPCLVIRGTPLASLWKQGEYESWSVDRAKEGLAAALLVLWTKDVRVIRLGLAPEGTLEDHRLAGPWHPALGQSARGLALFQIIKDTLSKHAISPSRLAVPRRYQGEFFGHGGELASRYQAIGVAKKMICYTDDTVFTATGIRSETR